MASFQYIARNAAGEEVAGVMQADSEVAVARTLDERQLFPVRISENAQSSGGMGGRIRLRDIGVMYGQLGDLLSAGVPLLRALDILARVGLNKRLAAVIARVREDVAAGEALAEAFGKHPEVFTSLHSAMVRAGERAGFLEEVLTNLAGFIERQDELRSKVRGALVYPAVLVTVGTLLIVSMLVFLVPRFRPFFQNISLPVPTRVLFAISDLLRGQLWVLAGALVMIGILVRAAVRSESGRQAWDRWRLKIPLAGRAISMVSVTRFCRILGTMLANGVPILQALAISKDATGCALMAQSIERAAESVRGGEPLAEPLKKSGLFPPEIVEMIAVGEESNQLEKVLVQIADTVERRTSRQVDQAVRLIEPLILVLLAIVVAFVAVGLLYPIFTMSQTLK